ncbi:uncharacterized protein LOC143545951 [Bidens hawaiensis]|uniref:uncharacterized protein LOC143545951 n=1 Tax=Bidens hawaiensis TaxID=980011 RepID=UPI004049AF7D
MSTEHNNRGVIAKFMRFDTSPPCQQKQVYRRSRALSENYLQKSASIGSHENNPRTFRQKLRNEKKLKRIDERKHFVLRPNFGNAKHESRPLFLQDSHTGWEYKKQLLERSKRTKVRQESWFSKPVCRPDETKQRLEMVTRVNVSNYDGWDNTSVTKLPISKQFKSVNRSSSGNTRFKNMSKGDLRLSSVDPDKNVSANSQPAEFSCSFGVSFEKELPLEEGYTGEAYQPSPNSVLEPDNSSSSENGESVCVDLNGLWMKLQLLKSESEANQSNKSESVVSISQNTKPVRFLGPKESQQFLYLVDVLNEMGFHDENVLLNSETCMTDPMIFETIEKKYENQKSWSQADRWLLFDWINLGLTEVFRSKSLRRRMNNSLRRDVVEEELWNMLLNVEKNVNFDLSKSARWEEPWLELRDEVDSIVVEIEDFLFNELATEFITV